MSQPQHGRRTDAARAPGTLPDALPPPGEVVLDPVLRFQGVSIWYGATRAVADVDLDIPRNEVTAMIGPSGCGKSTLLRAINRMNDLIPGTRLEGRIIHHGEDLYDRRVDPVMVRRRIGMVFQTPNPFPRSIRDNVLFGPTVQGTKQGRDEIVEVALRRAALWDEVKDGLGRSALRLSGGQQQRLCIARAIATDPDVILMDEPCSALDPLATLRIEELMRGLTERYTILVVTHDMQQAARVSDRTAFISIDLDDVTGERPGRLVEFDRTELIFTQAKDPRTEAYITGRYG